jgi:hypothetical protein
MPMNIMVSCSLNSRRSRSTRVRTLPTTIPAAMAATNPLSAMRALLA